jgi:hypothetical protein
MPLLQKRTVIVPHAALYAPAPGGGGGGSLTLTGTDVATAWLTGISPPAVFTSMAAGAASSGRILAAIIAVDGNTTNGVVSACTIGGVAGAQRAGTPPVSGTGHGISCNGFPSGMAVMLVAVTGSATAAFSAGTQAAYNTGADPRSLTNTVPSNGVGVFAYVMDRDTTPTWSSATGLGSINHAGSNACDLIAAWTTSNTPSFTGANGFGGAGAIVSWAP